MSIILRKRELASGDQSLYLDIYIDGKRQSKSLKLKLVKPKSKSDRDLNRNTMELAEAKRAKWQLEIQARAHGFMPKSPKKVSLLTYVAQETERRLNRDVDYNSWRSTLKHLRIFCDTKDPIISEIDEQWLEDFKDYLLYDAKKPNGEKLSQNSAHHYFNRVKHIFKIAIKNKVISDNPADRVDYIQALETKKEHLTIEELQALANTECRYPLLKAAFLFSSLSGLRFSDVKQLIWSEVQHSDKTGWCIYFRQKKTNGVELLPISDQARSLLPENKGAASEQVFAGLKYSATYNQELVNWCRKAGIEKKISYHCSRHSYCVNLITHGADIYTVSKLMGHSDVKITTKVYAKHGVEKKIEAVNLIPQLKF